MANRSEVIFGPKQQIQFTDLVQMSQPVPEPRCMLASMLVASDWLEVSTNRNRFRSHFMCEVQLEVLFVQQAWLTLFYKEIGNNITLNIRYNYLT